MDQLELNDGIMVLVWEKGQGIFTEMELPRALITNVLTELHNSEISGHLGGGGGGAENLSECAD